MARSRRRRRALTTGSHGPPPDGNLVVRSCVVRPVNISTAFRQWRGTDAKGRSPRQRGRVLAALAVVVAGLLALHSAVPNAVGRLGSLLETFLPWLGLAVPVLLILALLRRSVLALVALLLPTAAWLGLFGGLM